MGKQTSKIKDFIYFGTDEIINVNTPEPIPEEKKKPFSIDYKSYGPRKFYKTGLTTQEATAQAEKNNIREQQLKQFKFYEDFDRVDYNEAQWFGNIQSMAQIWLKRVPILMFLLMGGYARQHYCEYMSRTHAIKCWIIGLAIVTPYWLFYFFTSPVYQPINHDMFRILPVEMQMYQLYDVEANLYKDVPKMKYETKYPTWLQYHTTKHKTIIKEKEYLDRKYFDYFQMKEGVTVDVIEELLKDREAQRAKGDYGSKEEFEKIKKETAGKVKSK